MSAFYDIARNPWPAVPRPEKGDERHLSLLIHAEVLTALLEVRESDETLQAKREDDAAGMLDSMQAVRATSIHATACRLLSGRVNLQLLDVTDHTSPSRRTIIYVMIKLAAASRKFPSSIYVRDIDVGQVRDPARLGGYADIFEASHRGRPVALKRLRALTTRESDLHKVRQTKLSRDSRLTSLSESLQGGPRLAPTRASLHPPIHRHRRQHLC
jgi:hypothetical protein